MYMDEVKNKVVGNTITGNDVINIDQEKLRELTITINQKIIDLKSIKERADIAWENCSKSLGDKTIEIDEKRIETNKEFNNSIQELETYTNILNSIIGIYNETEQELDNASKEFSDTITRAVRGIGEITTK